MKHGNEYTGYIVAVASAPAIKGGKPTLGGTVRCDDGTMLKTMFWLDQNDARNGFPSSFEKTKALFAYLGCTDFRPPFNGINPTKVVTFTYDQTPDGKGGFYREAKYVSPPPGVIVRNAMSAAEQLELFGGAPVNTDSEPRDFNAEAGFFPGTDDIPA